MTDDAAREILIRGARALAHEADPSRALGGLLATTIDQLGIASAVIVVRAPDTGELAIVGSAGLGDQAATGLLAAMQDPTHPIVRTFAEPAPSFDVLPTRPGGPALRSHLPLIIGPTDVPTVVGVLALAHAEPIDEGSRALLSAVTDLAAATLRMERARPGS